MVDGVAGEVFEAHPEAHRAVHGDQDGVLPGAQPFRAAAARDDLEGVGVQVEGVVEHAHVGDLPLLDGAQAHAGVDPAGVEDLAVDGEDHPPPRPHAVAQHEAAAAYRRAQFGHPAGAFGQGERGLALSPVDQVGERPRAGVAPRAAHHAPAHPHAAVSAVVGQGPEGVAPGLAVPAHEHLGALARGEQQLVELVGFFERAAVGGDQVERVVVELQAVEARGRGVEQPQAQQAALLEAPLGLHLAVHRHQRALAAAHELHGAGRRHPAAGDLEVLEDGELLARRGHFGHLVELAPHHEEAGHPQEDLLGHQPVQVRVVPEGAGRVVLGNLETVG